MYATSSRLLLVAMWMVALMAIQACRSAKEPGTVVRSSDRPPIAEVLERHSAELMAVEGVVGTYEGRTEDGLPCIKIMVVENTESLRSKLPQSLEGYPVVLRETGEIAPVDKQ